MWFIQTPVDALLLPTDGAGRLTLTGNAAPWHHLVRDGAFSPDSRASIANAPVRWSIWQWEQTPRRVRLPEALGNHESLAFMVRAEPTRACVFVQFPKSGKRKLDDTIEVIVVVPPEQFARYQSLVQFAMTMPGGYVGLTLPSPIVVRDGESGSSQTALIEADSSALMEGMELVVARGTAQTFTTGDIHAERRAGASSGFRVPSTTDDEDWLLFAAAPIHEESGESDVTAD